MAIDFTVRALDFPNDHEDPLHLVKNDPQPQPLDIWGFELPIALPQELWPWITARAELITGIWQRDERHYFKSNMRLNEILEHVTDWFFDRLPTNQSQVVKNTQAADYRKLRATKFQAKVNHPGLSP